MSFLLVKRDRRTTIHVILYHCSISISYSMYWEATQLSIEPQKLTDMVSSITEYLLAAQSFLTFHRRPINRGWWSNKRSTIHEYCRPMSSYQRFCTTSWPRPNRSIDFERHGSRHAWLAEWQLIVYGGHGPEACEARRQSTLLKLVTESDQGAADNE